MRLWPKKKWKKIMLISFLAIVAIGAVTLGYFGPRLNNDVVSGIDVINAGGTKMALIVYQVGLSSLPKDVSYAFADGLASSGWKVEITTASPQAPSDLSKYSLLILGFPAYGGSPGTAIVRYVDRLANLHGINIAIIACAAGNIGGSVDTMKQKVQAAGGIFVKSIALFTLAPNEGNRTAVDIAKQTGAQILP